VDTFKNVTARNVLESFHDAQQAMDVVMTLFSSGYLTLDQRALAENLFWTICKKIRRLSEQLDYVPEELEGLDTLLSDTYFCNFSLFQSMPDSWAIKQLFPVIEGGKAKWSFVHIEDAARATVAALTAEPGKYVVVDDDTSPVNVWLPRFASFVGAPRPPLITEDKVLQTAGEDAVYYQTKLCGASNAKAKRALHFAPRQREWLSE
jgi:hypothetical protein